MNALMQDLFDVASTATVKSIKTQAVSLMLRLRLALVDPSQRLRVKGLVESMKVDLELESYRARVLKEIEK